MVLVSCGGDDVDETTGPTKPTDKTVPAFITLFAANEDLLKFVKITLFYTDATGAQHKEEITTPAQFQNETYTVSSWSKTVSSYITKSIVVGYKIVAEAKEGVEMTKDNYEFKYSIASVGGKCVVNQTLSLSSFSAGGQSSILTLRLSKTDNITDKLNRIIKSLNNKNQAYYLDMNGTMSTTDKITWTE